MLIRATHPYAFRAGEWARLVTTITMSPPGSARCPRECYLVRFPDGQSDFWPVADGTCGYEMREEEHHRPGA